MELNSHCIDLKEVFKEHNHKLCVNPQTIRKVLTDLHMDEEEEITITGTYGEWGWFCNLLLSQVLENDIEGVE
jgi:hypothetical protein